MIVCFFQQAIVESNKLLQTLVDGWDSAPKHNVKMSGTDKDRRPLSVEYPSCERKTLPLGDHEVGGETYHNVTGPLPDLIVRYDSGDIGLATVVYRMDPVEYEEDFWQDHAPLSPSKEIWDLYKEWASLEYGVDSEHVVEAVIEVSEHDGGGYGVGISTFIWADDTWDEE